MSKIVAQGEISISATYLNLNGIIQSGVTDLTLTIAEDFAPTETISLLSQGGSGRKSLDDFLKPYVFADGIIFGEVPFKSYFDAATQSIVIEEIVTTPGRVTLTGQIFNTGRGQILVADGAPNINVRNNSEFDLVFDGVDLAVSRPGQLVINDTSRLRKTEYIFASGTIVETNFQGTLEDGRVLYAEITDPGGQIIHDTETLANIRSEFELSPEFANRDLLRDTEGRVYYQPTEGMYYSWVEGQAFSQVEVRKYEENSFNLVGANWSFLVGNNDYKFRTVQYTDARPLLESELLLDATELPPFIVDQDYGLAFELVRNTQVPMLEGVTQVRDVRTSKIYTWVGSNVPVELTSADFSDSNLWEDTGLRATFDFENIAANQYNSSFQNYTYEQRDWTTGGGWLRQKTYHTETITETGFKDYYTHYLRADYPVLIDSVQGRSEEHTSELQSREL
jgi:hypothetical protein